MLAVSEIPGLFGLQTAGNLKPRGIVRCAHSGPEGTAEFLRIHGVQPLRRVGLFWVDAGLDYHVHSGETRPTERPVNSRRDSAISCWPAAPSAGSRLAPERLFVRVVSGRIQR